LFIITINIQKTASGAKLITRDTHFTPGRLRLVHIVRASFAMHLAARSPSINVRGHRVRLPTAKDTRDHLTLKMNFENFFVAAQSTRGVALSAGESAGDGSVDI
jgi:hypothetical protein